MKENYTVSFVKDNVGQARLVKAESKDQALAYFAEIEPTAIVHGASLDQCNLERRGCPVETVPDGWQPATSEQEQAEQQTTTAEILSKAADIINGLPARSAWSKGVISYALELLDNLADLTPGDLSDLAKVRRALLNGADTWQQYSYGGSALIYDGDIAERLCNPSGLKRCKGGDRNPNSRETWLDVQARALFRAALTVRASMRTAVKEVLA